MQCGSRSVVDILKIINDVFNGVLGELPCYNTIDNWVKKCGLDISNNSGQTLSDTPYAMIVDDSMMVGSEKLLLALGIPAKHQGHPLKHSDITFLDMSVASTWNGIEIQKRLESCAKGVGHHPEYVISDNASVMCKGIRLAGYTHHRDISHSLGMFLERTYKNETDFKEFTKLMSNAQFKHNMKAVAHLLPPTQRTIARFMNLTSWVDWAGKMLAVYHRFSREEKQVFSFIPQHASLVEELKEVMSCITFIENECKHQGLSRQTIDRCETKIREVLFPGTERMQKIGESICQFLDKEVSMMKDDDYPRNNSSDIIESTFGVFKARKSPNKLYGVTSFVLFLPAHAQMASDKSPDDYKFKEHLENIKIWQINEWANTYLTKNLVCKRSCRLKNAG